MRYRKLSFEENKQSALRMFSENPYWKEYYDNAPSGNCREYIELQFLTSKTRAYEDIAEARMNELEEQLGIEDWKHIARYSGNNQFRWKCRKKIKELEDKQART